MKPHAGHTVLEAGAALDRARAAMIMIHGRGSTAENILALHEAFDQPDYAYRAPRAADNSWYPLPFLASLKKNEPGISSSLWVIGRIIDSLESGGIPAHRIVLLGFSQGACLSLEYAARNPRRYGAVIGLSGGLIGPPGTEWRRNGSLEGTPVFLGCSDIDFHIPKTRVQETSELMRSINAEVTERLYPGMPHTINQDEIEFVKGLLREVIRSATS